ncbi:MAG: DUF6580 family putative transport protein [Patescibacteria group bacterium UBA2163]
MPHLTQKHIILIAGTLLILGVLLRLAPHMPNMTPITAIAFVGAMYLGRRWAIALPLLALLASDLLIGFYDWKIMASVYGSFALIACISWITRTHRNVVPVGLSLFASSVIFFIVTNGAVWALSPWYEKSVTGLFYAYELGLPFFRNMLIGDVLYTTGLVAMFETARIVFRVPFGAMENIHSPTPPVLPTEKHNYTF